ncbi:MAG: 3-dehydroquinate synthase [Pyrinomonadaceae bacterium]|nr:3-dehydroquinate synthase [Pyrinomonadaceae bacterium]
MPRLPVRTRALPHKYEITIGRGTLRDVGQVARDCLGERSQRLALISNRKVFSLYGRTVMEVLQAQNFSVSSWLIDEGESQKSLRTLASALQFLTDTGLQRSDGVVALGGGVVGDLAGFAAAVYLRGVPLIQVPTTLLAQVDSSVGGKTGVNLAAGKNLVGSFHQPQAVVVDLETLTTLPKRELTAGLCECVKQGAVGSRKLFKQTNDFLLESRSPANLTFPQLEQLIAAHCAFKAAIVSGDERESLVRTDRRSRKILNFGHTIAHALETVTSYRKFRHGEAVGHGMLVAAELSKNLGLLAQSELELLRGAIERCGPLPFAGDLDEGELIKAIAHDKKRAAGRLQWILLERIGRPRILDGGDVSPALLRRSLRAAFKKRK